MIASEHLLAGLLRSAALICLIQPAALAADLVEGARPPSASAGHADELALSWADLVRLVDQHPRLATATHQAQAARAAVSAAGAIPNPTLEASAAYGRAWDTPASRAEWGLALSFPLGWIATRGSKVAAADAQAASSLAQRQALRREVLLELGALYWRLVFEQERVATLVELRRQADAQAATVRRRVESGEARPVEASRVELEAGRAAAELEAAQAALAALRAQLSAWLGLGQQQRLVAKTRLTPLPAPPTAARVRRQLTKTHPALAAAQARVQSQQAEVSVQRWARVPSLSLAAFADHGFERWAYGVGLAIDLPLWNFNSGNLERAEHQLAAERTQLAAEQRDLEAAGIAVQAGCQANVRLARHFQEQALPQAEAIAGTIERSYQLGEAPLLEMIDARRTLIETRRQALGAMFQAQLDCCRLRVLLGEVKR